MDIQRSSSADETPAPEVIVDDSDDPHRQPPTPPQPPIAQHPHISAHQFATGHGQVPPLRPPDPIGGFMGRSMPHRRAEWLILWLVLILAGLVLTAACLTGFAIYNGRFR